MSKDPQNTEQFRDALQNLDKYLEDAYKITDIDNDGHINIHEFENIRDELWHAQVQWICKSKYTGGLIWFSNLFWGGFYQIKIEAQQ